MPLEQTDRHIIIGITPSSRFIPGSIRVVNMDRGGRWVKIEGKLRSTGRWNAQSIRIPVQDAHLERVKGKMVVVTRSQAVANALFHIRQNYTVRMKIRLVR